jgi:outer membrane lipoprotein SlyB
MLAGCANMEQQVSEHPNTAVGAVAGAAGGALLGGLIFRNTTGAVIGGLVGGLTGGLIGNATEAKKQDQDATNRQYGYRTNQGTVVRIEEVQAEPARVAPGGTVNLAVEYALMTPRANQEVTVAERWNITSKGQTMGNPVHTVRHTGGTWGGSLPITLPRSTAPGTYRAVVTIEADGRSDSRETTFTVRR